MDVRPNCRTRQNGGISADGTTYTVHLRPGAKWNTSPACEVTSEDVVLGLKRLSTGEPCRGLGNGHERLNTGSAPFPSIRTGCQRCRPKEGVQISGGLDQLAGGCGDGVGVDAGPGQELLPRSGARHAADGEMSQPQVCLFD